MNNLKYFLFFLIGLLLPSLTSADCSSSAISVFPSGSTVRQNPVFVVEGYAQSQSIIRGLNERYPIYLAPVYLMGSNKKIKLIETEFYVGQFNVNQIILKPETSLEAGQEYVIVIDNVPQDHYPEKFNKTFRRFELAKYKVLAGEDRKKPKVISQPKKIGETVKYYGSGPAIFATFDFPVKDDSEVIIKTMVKNLATGQQTTYYLEL